MLKFFLHFCKVSIKQKYYCYGWFNANKINTILLYFIIPIALLAYYLMYKYLPAKDVTTQWDVNFISESIQMFIMAFMIFHHFKGTRHFGMATSVLVYFVFNLVNNIKGVYMKLWWASTMWQLVMLGLAFFCIYDYLSRAKKNNDGDIAKT